MASADMCFKVMILLLLLPNSVRGFGVWSLFCAVVLSDFSSFAINLLRRGQVALF